MGSRRRVRVEGRGRVIVIGIGVVTSIGVGLRGASPTGSAVTDWIVLIPFVTLAVWAAASAPWWSLTSLAAIAAGVARPVGPLLIGVGVLLLSFAVGARRRDQPAERAVVAGASMLVLSMARDIGPFGLTSVLGVSAVTAVAGLGLWRRPRRDRRIGIAAVAAGAGIAIVGLLGTLSAGLAARPDLATGERLARQGLRELARGELDGAQSAFEQAATAFRRADDDLGAPWSQVGRLVPLAGQHRAAGATLASAAASTTGSIARQLARIDLERLRVVDGRIDVDAVRDLREPMRGLETALDDFQRAVADADDRWLVPPVRDRLRELRIEIEAQQRLGATAGAALDVAPALLGADGKRVYFVMFTTPAEARGSGGFMGNFAEITIDDGVIEMTRFGRHSDLNIAGGGNFTLSDAPRDWINRYGPEGFEVGPSRSVVRDPWSIINLSPHFPSTAHVVAELYPQSGGRRLDGVFSLDVYALERLIGLVGPLPVEDGARRLDGRNAARYLLVDQYRFAEDAGREARVDQLEVVAHTAADRLFRTMPPDPVQLGRQLAPMVEERRLLGWFADPREQDLLRTVDMDGELLGNRVDEDGIAVVLVNDGASKMDTYLGRSMRLTPTDAGDELLVEVTHGAPVAELGAAVVGDTSDLEPGWARLWLTVNTSRLVDGVRLDGRPVDVNLAVENGVGAYGIVIELAPGASSTVRFDLAPSRIGARHLVVQPQPLVQPEVWTTPAGTFEVVEERRFPWPPDASGPD